jgi:hypothetical protein
MFRTISFATALLVATPTLAAPIVLTIQNNSSHVVTRLNVFGVDKDLVPIEDNVGAISEDIPAGATGTLELGMSKCQPVYAAMVLDEREDVSTTIDTCKSTTLVVSD